MHNSIQHNDIHLNGSYLINAQYNNFLHDNINVTLGITPFNIMTLGITIKNVTLGIKAVSIAIKM
jgi:hypothetical protein